MSALICQPLIRSRRERALWLELISPFLSETWVYSHEVTECFIWGRDAWNKAEDYNLHVLKMEKEAWLKNVIQGMRAMSLCSSVYSISGQRKDGIYTGEGKELVLWSQQKKCLFSTMNL